MPNAILDGLSLVDAVGTAVLVANAACLLLGIGVHAVLRARYAALRRDLDGLDDPRPRFRHRVLERIFGEAEEDARRAGEPNTQAIVEDAFQSDLRGLLLGERFLRAATGLALILGLLGTFYGLTLSIGRLVHLVSADPGTSGDVAQALTRGLTQGLSGMAAAFSNSLVGVVSAVVLSVLGVVNNVTDLRTGLMIRIETVLARKLPRRTSRDGAASAASDFADAVRRLEGAVVRFESALQSFATKTNDLREVHLVVALKPGERS
jgi:hypothetical protein